MRIPRSIWRRYIASISPTLAIKLERPGYWRLLWSWWSLKWRQFVQTVYIRWIIASKTAFYCDRANVNSCGHGIRFVTLLTSMCTANASYCSRTCPSVCLWLVRLSACLFELLNSRSQMWRLYAMAMYFCLSVSSVVCLSSVKFVKSFARWQHLAASVKLFASTPICTCFKNWCYCFSLYDHCVCRWQ